MGQQFCMLGCQERRSVLNDTRIFPSRLAGFSLIELMIGVAMLALLLTLAAPGFLAFVKNGEIRASAEAVLNGLQLARSEAVRRNAQVQFSLTNIVSGGGETGTSDWVVREVSSGESLQVRSAAEGGRSVLVTVADSSQAVITFNGLGRSRDGAAELLFYADADTPEKCTDLTATFRCLKVTVSVGGQVRMCDDRRPAGDPQKC